MLFTSYQPPQQQKSQRKLGKYKAIKFDSLDFILCIFHFVSCFVVLLPDNIRRCKKHKCFQFVHTIFALEMNTLKSNIKSVILSSCKVKFLYSILNQFTQRLHICSQTCLLRPLNPKWSLWKGKLHRKKSLRFFLGGC